jgi:hypothetical protein
VKAMTNIELGKGRVCISPGKTDDGRVGIAFYKMCREHEIGEIVSDESIKNISPEMVIWIENSASADVLIDAVNACKNELVSIENKESFSVVIKDDTFNDFHIDKHLSMKMDI